MNKPYPQAIIEDRYKKPLNIDDQVAFSRGNYTYVGKVVYYTPKGITCCCRNNGRLISIQNRNKIVKL